MKEYGNIVKNLNINTDYLMDNSNINDLKITRNIFTVSSIAMIGMGAWAIWLHQQNLLTSMSNVTKVILAGEIAASSIIFGYGIFKTQEDIRNLKRK